MGQMTNNEFPSLGRHVLIELFDCDPVILNDVSAIEKILTEAAKKAGATIIHTIFHHFSPHGISGIVVIQESHLSIHTWPEYGYAAVDIYTCGPLINPWIPFSIIKEKLKAKFASPFEILRGQKHLLSMSQIQLKYNPYDYLPDKKIPTPPSHQREIWFTEKHENVAYSFRYLGENVYKEFSQYQTIEILDTIAYGKMLVLDGLVMTSEKDEFCYHEMLVHPAMVIHPNPIQILIIGGGDGGTASQIVKYPYIQKVDVVEIDQRVIEVSKKFLPKIAKGFEDPRVNIIIQDGANFVINSPSNVYDIIYVDCSDPLGPSSSLFTEDFYRNLLRIIKKDGIVIIQTESPQFSLDVMQSIYSKLVKTFGGKNVFMYHSAVPTYTTGFWTFAFCSKVYHPIKNLDYKKSEKISKEFALNYYTPQIHLSAFVLPPYIQKSFPNIANAFEDLQLVVDKKVFSEVKN